MTTSRTDRVLKELAAGRPIVLCDDDSREGEGDLAFPASAATAELVNFTLSNARGLLCVSISQAIANRLGIERIRSNARDPYGTPFGTPVSLATRDSGISAAARAATVRSLGDVASTPERFCMPGHVATLIAHEGGLRQRNGHTEAIQELLKICGLPAAGVLCEMLEPSGEIAKRPYLDLFAKKHELMVLDILEIENYLGISR